MAHIERNGKRKTRDQLAKRRVPELGYYFIVTDTEETEQNYMYGLRASIPKELQGKLVISLIFNIICLRFIKPVSIMLTGLLVEIIAIILSIGGS